MIGCEVWTHDQAGKQFRISAHDGHFGGSLDSVIRGCPDVAPGLAILGEFKTHNEKSFEKLEKDGVRSAKFEHFVQQQVYMGGYQLPASLYLGVNKNNDELYGEIIPFDPEQYRKFVDRGRLVVLAATPPPKCNPSPGWWKCKWCDHRAVCHANAEPHRNCRTCIHSHPVAESQWVCDHRNGAVISKEVQVVGCSDYRWIPM